MYGLLRPLPMGLNPRQRVHRILGTGHIRPFADVEFLGGGGTLERTGTATTYYSGLPPYMAFAAPSGFLGRQLASATSRLHPFPASLKDWNDDHRVAYLFTQGLNLPGNLVYGDVSLQREFDLLAVGAVPVAEKLAHYVDMASTFKAATFGSSAGGEQPKFLSLTDDRGHVIVKFAERGSRMAQLLPLEHLALQALQDVSIPAARTHLLAAGNYVFLEVERFDRLGKTGRIGLLSAGAIDDEFFGRRDSWSEFAARCVQARHLSPADAQCIDTIAAFSELIGNNDRHFENVALLIDENGEYSGVAPAYDILPTRYASLGGGIDPALTPIEPRVGTIGTRPEVWNRAARAAEHFWMMVQSKSLKLAVPVSREIKLLAAQNLKVAVAFVAPLVQP